MDNEFMSGRQVGVRRRPCRTSALCEESLQAPSMFGKVEERARRVDVARTRVCDQSRDRSPEKTIQDAARSHGLAGYVFEHEDAVQVSCVGGAIIDGEDAVQLEPVAKQQLSGIRLCWEYVSRLAALGCSPARHGALRRGVSGARPGQQEAVPGERVVRDTCQQWHQLPLLPGVDVGQTARCLFQPLEHGVGAGPVCRPGLAGGEFRARHGQRAALGSGGNADLSRLEPVPDLAKLKAKFLARPACLA